MKESKSNQPEPGEKLARKKQKFVPYKVRLGGKTFWQVNLESEYLRRSDGSIVRVRPRRTFSSAEEARGFARLKKVERANRGVLGVSMDDRLRADALEASELLRPYQATLVDAAKEYALRRERLANSQTLSQSVNALLEAKAGDHLRARYLKDLRVRLTRFGRDFGERKLSDISSAEIDRWLRALGLSPRTRNTFHTRIFTLFEYGRSNGWVDANPVAAVRKVKAPETLPGILSLEEAARLLETAATETLPYWALGLFCGLRSAELERLKWEDIHFDEATLEVPALSSKTASRRCVPLRANLLEWLTPYQDKRGSVCPANLRNRLSSDRDQAGITKWPSNALRHSFGSYHLAAFQNAALCAAEMGHVSAAVTYRFYNQRVRPALAQEFWRIAPAIDAAHKLTALARA
jgi:integrase